jgi:hypothetical protein
MSEGAETFAGRCAPHGVLVQAYPFDRYGFLFHHWAFFVEDDFVFFLAPVICP